MGYEVFLNFSDIDIGEFYKNLSSVGEVIYTGDRLLVWLDEGKTKKSLYSKIKKSGINDFFCKELVRPSDNKVCSFVDTWICEKFNAEEIKKLERDRQDSLQKMNENLKRANELLEKVVQNRKQN